MHLVTILASACVLGAGIARAQEPAAGGEEKKEKESPWVVAPTVTANPAFGNGGGATAMYLFKASGTADKSPTSLVGAIGVYSDTESYFVGVYGRTFWDDDSWRLSGGLVNGRINNEIDVEGVASNIEFETNVNALFARYDRRITGDFFLGGLGRALDFDYVQGNDASAIYFPIAGVEDQFAGQIGVVAMHDSRDQIYWPQGGGWSELRFILVPEWLGSDSDYYVTEVFTNRYVPLAPDHVLAARLYGRFTPSDTPYSGLSTLGRRSDLRGYTASEFVAQNLVTLQAEYRWMFTERFGVVAFGGVSELWNGSWSNWDSSTFHPAGGAGLRFTLNKTNRLNLRIDYAFGDHDEEGLYVSVGEAF